MNDIRVELSADVGEFDRQLKRLEGIIALTTDNYAQIVDAQRLGTDGIYMFGRAVGAFYSTLSPAERALFRYENGLK